MSGQLVLSRLTPTLSIQGRLDKSNCKVLHQMADAGTDPVRIQILDHRRPLESRGGNQVTWQFV